MTIFRDRAVHCVYRTGQRGAHFRFLLCTNTNFNSGWINRRNRSVYHAFSVLQKVQLRNSAKVIIPLSVSFLLVEAENILDQAMPFSGLLALMAVGIAIQTVDGPGRQTFQQILEIMGAAKALLFVLVGQLSTSITRWQLLAQPLS